MSVVSVDMEAQFRGIVGARLKINEPLSAYTTLRIGGPADFLATANSTDEIVALINIARVAALPWRILGRGSNLLVSDRGARGLTIRNSASVIKKLAGCDEAHAMLVVDAGVSCARLASHAARLGLSGVEFLVSIPGTIGGAIVQDAGAHGHEIADVLRHVDFLDANGHIHTREVADLELGYRTSWFKKQLGVMAVLRGYLALTVSDPETVTKQIGQHRLWRAASQPPEPSAGSIFTNPPGDFAGRLIEAAGLKGLRIGDAQVSTRHANFIINLGSATAHDVIAIIQKARHMVNERFDVQLEPEIEQFGDWL